MPDREDRFHPRDPGNPDDGRSPARRDRDRILYSSALRRLSGITQVISPTENQPIHNRLTHTLEVAQIGRSIAENLLRSPENAERAAALGGLDPDVVEAAALAHDLGHPPFGHVSERELDDLVKNHRRVPDGFEGNAQSFRIVTKLAVRYPDVDGLNLTRATLDAILKYPWPRATTGRKAAKWGAYGSEEPGLAWARRLHPAGSDAQSLEAALMDWSDDVAYAVHDLEDFFRAGLIPLDRLATDPLERERFLDTEVPRHRDRYPGSELIAAFTFVTESSPILEPYRGRREDRARLRSFTSGLIDRYVGAVSLGESTDDDSGLLIDRGARLEVAMLKGLTWHYVIESHSLTTQRFCQRALIRSLFSVLADAAAAPADRHVFPELHQEMLRTAAADAQVVRLVADLISSMSESQAVEMHHRLTGLSLGSAMDPIIT